MLDMLLLLKAPFTVLSGEQIVALVEERLARFVRLSIVPLDELVLHADSADGLSALILRVWSAARSWRGRVSVSLADRIRVQGEKVVPTRHKLLICCLLLREFLQLQLDIAE